MRKRARSDKNKERRGVWVWFAGELAGVGGHGTVEVLGEWLWRCFNRGFDGDFAEQKSFCVVVLGEGTIAGV